jgi:hypothetical protein
MVEVHLIGSYASTPASLNLFGSRTSLNQHAPVEASLRRRLRPAWRMSPSVDRIYQSRVGVTSNAGCRHWIPSATTLQGWLHDSHFHHASELHGDSSRWRANRSYLRRDGNGTIVHSDANIGDTCMRSIRLVCYAAWLQCDHPTHYKIDFASLKCAVGGSHQLHTPSCGSSTPSVGRF